MHLKFNVGNMFYAQYYVCYVLKTASTSKSTTFTSLTSPHLFDVQIYFPWLRLNIIVTKAVPLHAMVALGRRGDIAVTHS
jgi:hypothetical protein